MGAFTAFPQLITFSAKRLVITARERRSTMGERRLPSSISAGHRGLALLMLGEGPKPQHRVRAGANRVRHPDACMRSSRWQRGFGHEFTATASMFDICHRRRCANFSHGASKKLLQSLDAGTTLGLQQGVRSLWRHPATKAGYSSD